MRGLGAVGDARRVLGVDPSVRRAGLVVVDVGRGQRPVWVHGEEVRQGAGDDAERLSALAQAVARAVAEWRPDLVAVEDAYVGAVGGRSVVLVAAGVGAALGAAAAAGVPVTLVSRARACQCIGAACRGKAPVQRLVGAIVAAAPAGLSQHLADAAAVALAAVR